MVYYVWLREMHTIAGFEICIKTVPSNTGTQKASNGVGAHLVTVSILYETLVYVCR